MEDILALIIVLAIAGLFVWIGAKVYSRIKQERERKAILRQQHEKYIDSMRKKYTVSKSMEGYVNMLDRADPVKVHKPAKKESFSREMDYVKPETRRSDNSDDGFLTGALVGYAVNSLLHSGDSNASEERSVGVRSSESSWGLDDSDSRSSISSSMDTSSSWSSSDFGSSDSGPSSDW